MTATSTAADGGVGVGKADDRVFVLDVATHQFVRLADADHFLHAIERLEGSGFQLSAVPGDADSGSRGAGHGMGAQSEALNFLANGTHLLFRCVGLHDDKHDQPLVTL